MPDSLTGSLNLPRILFDLQQANEIVQGFSGCLEPETIAQQVTQGLVEKFGVAFARIWLLEPDQTILKLVASAGMYTHTDGFFGRIPLGAYKVGKIAQNRVSFLSNNLAAESWVGNRDWAIANDIRGFAGYPLAIKDQVVGVLATFSHHAMEPEFLEVLQTLCTTVAIVLDTAVRYQSEKRLWQVTNHRPIFSDLPLSEQLVSMLSTTRLTLVGTERPLSLTVVYVFLKAAELLNQMGRASCRLSYGEESVVLEALVPTLAASSIATHWMDSLSCELLPTVSGLGGVLQTQISPDQRALQVMVELPYGRDRSNQALRIRCRLPLLQCAFIHLAVSAGFTICPTDDIDVVLFTDDPVQAAAAKRVIWIQQGNQAVPKGVQAKVDLSIDPAQLQEVVATVMQDQQWGVESEPSGQVLSERELEVLVLLTQGYRDRDIAEHLIISESTVKFHMNNVLTKLKVRTRYQAIHQAILNGWI